MMSTTDRIERQIELKAPVSRVWRALTDHQEFGQWFGVALDGPFLPGQPSTGHMTNPKYSHVAWKATVKEIRPETLFSYTWHPYAMDQSVDYSAEPPTLVEFRLTPIAGGTRLEVIESGFDRIPAHRRDEAFRNNGNGWTAQIRNIERYVTQPVEQHA
ncbi:MAG TPA: SRPBCC family protein [Gemmatimonadaceae bacterium]|nr:SRPBCC family protein [Gemmatimonadaceae bacterium]